MLNGPFRGSVAVARGLVTKNQLRGPRYRRLYPDIYLPTPTEPVTLAIRSRAAFLLVEPGGGVLSGYSASALLGTDCAPLAPPAEVIVGGARRVHPGLLVRRGVVIESDRRRRHGCMVTSPERTGWDLARRLDLVEAVVVVDALSRLPAQDARGPAPARDLRRFAPVDLLARREREPGARGCRHLDQVVALADPRAESPMETRLRLLLVMAGLPAPAVQHELLDEHGFVVARFDLAYPDELLAIEYDGRGHRRREFSDDDRWRDTSTGDHGWHTMRFGPDDVQLSKRRTVALVRRQLELRAHLGRMS